MTRTREENAADLMRDAAIQLEDSTLTADQLDHKYNQDGGGQHPVHTRDDWINAVSNDETLIGYWDWVEHQIELAHQA